MTASIAEPPRSPWTVLISTSLAIFAVFLDTTILFVAFSAIGRSFPIVSASSLSWVLNAYTIVFAATLIPAGRLADRVGRRTTFLYGAALFTIASMLCGVAPSVPVLVAARVLQAIGAAALVPSSLALVLQTFPRDKVPLAVAIWTAISAAAGAIGPTLGALVVEHLGWRWAFYVNLPVGIVSILLGFRVLPRLRAAVASQLPDPVGVVLLIGSLSSMAYAIVETEAWGWSSATFFAVLGLSLLLLIAFLVRCARVANPLIDLALFKSSEFRLANSGMLIFCVGFTAMFLGNILFLTRVWGYSILQAGMTMSAGPLVVAMSAPLFGRLAGRVWQRALLIPGGLTWAAAGGLLIHMSTRAPQPAWHYVAAVMCCGLGVSMCIPQLSSASVQGLPAANYGAGAAINQSVRNLGGTLGVALAVAFTSRPTPGDVISGFHHVWLLLVVSGLAVSSFAWFLPQVRTASVPADLLADSHS